MRPKAMIVATVEFDAALVPLARITLPNKHSGYIHYETLVAKLREKGESLPDFIHRLQARREELRKQEEMGEPPLDEIRFNPPGGLV